MKKQTTQILSYSLFALLLSGCYTQLEVVERPAAHYDRYERPQPNRAYNPQDEMRLDERGYAIDEFSEESYYAGYDDGFTDLEIYFRDYSRQPVLNRSNQYALGYHDGYRDASWSFHRHRYHSRYYGPHWDPFWYTGHSTFFVSWGWHRPHHFWHHSPHHFYGYYSYPVYYHGFHGYHGWGGHRNTWIVYNYNVINNNTSVNRGPRNSGIARDRTVTGRNVATSGNRGDVRTNTSSTRSSGVNRDNTEVGRSTPAQTGRTRGTVTRSPSTDGRSSGTTRSGVRQGGSSSGSTGTVQRGNTSGGRSSGTVRSGGNRSGGSSSDSGTRRPRGNDLQSSNQLPAVLPGETNSRQRITQERPVVQQPPRTATTRVRTTAVTNSTSPVNTPRVRQDEVNRPATVNRQPATTVQRPAQNTVTRTPQTASPARTVAQPPRQQQAPATNARPAPRQTPAARPAPAPAAQPAPPPQRSQPAASPQRNTSRNDSGSSTRSRNRD